MSFTRRNTFQICLLKGSDPFRRQIPQEKSSHAKDNMVITSSGGRDSRSGFIITKEKTVYKTLKLFVGCLIVSAFVLTASCAATNTAQPAKPDAPKPPPETHDAAWWLNNAKACAMEMPGGFRRDDRLWQIGQAQANAGLYADALATAQELHDDLDKTRVITAVAEAQANAGKRDEASKTLSDAIQTLHAKEKETGRFMDIELADIAEAQAHIGMISDALKTVDQLQRSYCADALCAIAVAQAKAGMADQAFAILRDVTDQVKKVEALTSIAKAQAAANKRDDAARTSLTAFGIIQSMPDGTHHEPLSYKPYVLWEFIQNLIDAGLFDEAKTFSVQTLNLAEQARMLSDIIYRQAETDKRDSARETIALLTALYAKAQEPKDLVYIQTEIADGHFRVGNLDSANKTLAEALAGASALKNPKEKAAALALLACIQESMGKRDEASGTFALATAALKAIGDDAYKTDESGSVPMEIIILDEAFRGFIDEALKLEKEWPATHDKSGPMWNVVLPLFLTSNGRYDEAMELARKVTDPHDSHIYMIIATTAVQKDEQAALKMWTAIKDQPAEVRVAYCLGAAQGLIEKANKANLSPKGV